MSKIQIIITNGKKNEIMEELKNLNFDLDKVEISEHKRKSLFKAKIKFRLFCIKSTFQILYQNIKELIKYRSLEPRFGGGGLDVESFYGLVFNLFTAIIIPGVAFDTIKYVIKESYKFFKSKKLDYLVIVTQVRQPSDCKIKILIPNNLNEEDLDYVLYQASEILNSLDRIRNYFGKRQIVVKCIQNYRWKIKFLS